MLEKLIPSKEPAQVPVGWWQDAKGRSQPPGSYLDPSKRLGPDGKPVGSTNTTASTATSVPSTGIGPSAADSDEVSDGQTADWARRAETD